MPQSLRSPAGAAAFFISLLDFLGGEHREERKTFLDHFAAEAFAFAFAAALTLAHRLF